MSALLEVAALRYDDELCIFVLGSGLDWMLELVLCSPGAKLDNWILEEPWADVDEGIAVNAAIEGKDSVLLIDGNEEATEMIAELPLSAEILND